jgi:hypothetical protein
MRTVVVTDRETKQVIACVPEYGDAICRKDVEVSVFNGTEPVFTETPSGPVLKENTFLINLGGTDNEKET